MVWAAVFEPKLIKLAALPRYQQLPMSYPALNEVLLSDIFLRM
jgi:hypothetical protein